MGVSKMRCADFTRWMVSAAMSAGTSCGRIAMPPRRAMVSAMRRPDTAVMFATISGIVVPVPSAVDGSTDMREPTADRDGTMNTSS